MSLKTVLSRSDIEYRIGNQRRHKRRLDSRGPRSYGPEIRCVRVGGGRGGGARESACPWGPLFDLKIFHLNDNTTDFFLQTQTLEPKLDPYDL